MGKTILRIICLLTFTFGLYRTDWRSAILFLIVMATIFWGLPLLYAFIFGKENYDGICYIDNMTDELTRVKINVYDPSTIISKKELKIKVDIPLDEEDFTNEEK